MFLVFLIDFFGRYDSWKMINSLAIGIQTDHALVSKEPGKMITIIMPYQLRERLSFFYLLVSQ
jgi:hypothetical protein